MLLPALMLSSIRWVPLGKNLVWLRCPMTPVESKISPVSSYLLYLLSLIIRELRLNDHRFYVSSESFIASASLPFLAIHRSTSSLFSSLSFSVCSSAMLSWRFKVTISSCTSSTSFVFPLNSSSLSFRRTVICVTPAESWLIRFVSIFDFNFSASSSLVTISRRVCRSARSCCALVRSCRICDRDSGGGDVTLAPRLPATWGGVCAAASSAKGSVAAFWDNSAVRSARRVSATVLAFGKVGLADYVEQAS